MATPRAAARAVPPGRLGARPREAGGRGGAQAPRPEGHLGELKRGISLSCWDSFVLGSDLIGVWIECDAGRRTSGTRS
jgi:hypothetical protein